MMYSTRAKAKPKQDVMKRLYTLLPAFIALLVSTSLFAQDIESFRLTTEDGKSIAAMFQMNPDQEKGQPTILLLHGGGRSKEIWQQFGAFQKLHELGYNVMAIDIRGNGQSDPQTPGNFVYPFADAKAALDWIEQNEDIQTGPIGAMGSSYGSNILAAGMQIYDWNIKTVVTLSATAVAYRVLANYLETHPLTHGFFVACDSELERYDAENTAQRLYDETTGERKIKILPGPYHGSYLYTLATDEILDWFETHLK